MIRDLGIAQLDLEPGSDGDIEIRVVFPDWKGIAHFPAPVAEEAYMEFRQIESPNDLEDLLRLWSDAETWQSFQEFRRREDF